MVDQPRQETCDMAERTVEFMGAEVPISELPMFCKVEGAMGLMFLFFSEELVLVPNQSESATGNDDILVKPSSRLVVLEIEDGTFDLDASADIDVAELERRLQGVRDLAEYPSTNPRVLLISGNSGYDDYRGPYSYLKKPLMCRSFIHPSFWNNGSERWFCSMAVGKTELMAVEHRFFEMAIKFEQPRRLFEKAVQSLPFDWKIKTSWQRTQAVLRSNGLIPMSFAKPGRPQVRASELHNLRSARGKAATGPRRRNRDNQLATRQPASHRALNRLRKSFNAQIKARQETGRAARTFKAVLNAAKE